MSTNGDPASVSRDSLWWISDQGIRYGIALNDSALKPLGIATASAQQAPWALIRVFQPVRHCRRRTPRSSMAVKRPAVHQSRRCPQTVPTTNNDEYLGPEK